MEPGVKNADTASQPISIHLPHNSLLSPSPHTSAPPVSLISPFTEPVLLALDAFLGTVLMLVMHSTMQETWKHSIHPATTLTPHPLAGTSRINITYRFYRQSYAPRFTPACKCGVEGVLRCVMKKGDNLGRYAPVPPVFMCFCVYRGGV